MQEFRYQNTGKYVSRKICRYATMFKNANFQISLSSSDSHFNERYPNCIWQSVIKESNDNFNCCFTVHLDKYKTILPTNALFLLKHKMLQFVFKISTYVAPICFGPFGPSSGSIRWNLAKVTVSLKSSAQHSTQCTHYKPVSPISVF